MPQIVVMTDAANDHEGSVLLRERVAPSDLESDHFSARLVERVGWAVLDADEIEHQTRSPERPDLARVRIELARARKRSRS